MQSHPLVVYEALVSYQQQWSQKFEETTELHYLAHRARLKGMLLNKGGNWRKVR